MTTDNIKAIINDARSLALDVSDVKLLRFGIERIAERLENLERADIAPATRAPLEGFAKALALPWLGTQFRRFKSAAETVCIAAWKDECNSHVYEFRVRRDGDTPNCGWRATGSCDGRLQISLTCKGRNIAEKCGLVAFRRKIQESHKRAFRRWNAERKAAKEGK